jgi:hypothetical protein
MKNEHLYPCFCIAIACGLASTACGGVDSTEVVDSTDGDSDGAEISTSGSQPALQASDQLTGEAFRAWTAYTSEEDPPAQCPINRLVHGVDCFGSYCDAISIDCELVSGFTFSDFSFGPWISEETTGGSTGGGDFICDSNEWMTGIRCAGSYCDFVSLECAESNARKGTCSWSGWFSEENVAFDAGLGRYIDGIDCAGSYCDLMRFHHCQPY